MLLVVLAALVQCPDGSPPPCAMPRPGPVPVAVLYFQNRSADPGDGYLAEGLTDEIIIRLTSIERLAVKSSTAVARFRGSSAPPDSLGRVLRVGHLVSGSVRRAGQRLAVTVELVRAPSGLTTWAGRFEGRVSDLLDMQAAIADTVARALVTRLLPEERNRLAARPTRNSRAYDRLLRGNFNLARRNSADVRAAIRDYQVAVSLDPGFAAAWARIGLAFGIALDNGYPEFELGPSLHEGMAAADRALALDSNLADGWMARAYMLRFINAASYQGVREAFARAASLAPRDAEVLLQYGWALEHIGERELSLATLRRAVHQDPERMIIRSTLSWVLLNARRPADVAALMDSAEQFGPDAARWPGIRGWGRLLSGDTTGAIADFDLTEGGAGYAGLAAIALARGDTARARQLVNQAVAEMPQAPRALTWRATMTAMAVAQLSDAAPVIAMLRRIEPQGRNVAWVLDNPGFDPVSGDPRFISYRQSLRR